MATEVHLDDAGLISVVNGGAPAWMSDHARACARCHDRLGTWTAIRGGALVAAEDAYRRLPASVVTAAVDRCRADANLAGPVQPTVLAPRRRIMLGWLILTHQVPLVKRSLAAASAVMVLVGAMVVLVGGQGRAGSLITLMAPLAAALGLALVHGPDVDPSLELTAATATSPRTILLARLVLVSGVDIVMALGATVLATIVAPGLTFGALVAAWLGPMLLLSSLSLTLAVLSRPSVGIAVSLGLWSLRVAAGGPNDFAVVSRHLLTSAQAGAMRDVWTTSLPTVGIAAAFVVVTLSLAPRRLRLAA